MKMFDQLTGKEHIRSVLQFGISVIVDSAQLKQISKLVI